MFPSLGTFQARAIAPFQRLVLSAPAATGSFACADAATIKYSETTQADGGAIATSHSVNQTLGNCTVVVSAFPSQPGELIVGSFEATLDKELGDGADSLAITGSFQVPRGEDL